MKTQFASSLCNRSGASCSSEQCQEIATFTHAHLDCGTSIGESRPSQGDGIGSLRAGVSGNCGWQGP